MNAIKRHTAMLACAALVLVTAAFTGCGDERSGGNADVDVEYNVRYWRGSGSSATGNALDIYIPRHGDNWPVAVVVHGGAWVAGSKNLVANIGYALAESGVAAVCVNYRLSPFVDHPAHVQDVSRAVAWTRANLGEYGADTSRIFLIGHSAGGHLVSLAGTKSVYLGDQGIDNADLSGVIAISGVYAIDNDVFELIFGDDPDEWAKASPINYASADDPPFMVLYAQNDMDDEVDLAAQAEEFYAELRAQGVEASLYEIPGANHNSIIGQIGKGGSASEQLILDFIDSH